MEKLRIKLNESILKYGISSKITLTLSEEPDICIVEYMNKSGQAVKNDIWK